MADSGAGPAGVSGAGDPAGDVDRAALEACRIVGHDGATAYISCMLCPPTRCTYAARGTLAAITGKAIEHYKFLHETQVAART